MPSGYARVRLNLNLHPKQAQVVDSLFEKDKSKVVFLCGNEVGKSTHTGAPAILYALEMLNCMVVVTSATYRQLSAQIMPALKRFASLYSSNWEFQENQIKINGEIRFIMFSSTSDSKSQGFHKNNDRPLLIIVDEAAGVADEIFHAIARNNPSYLLIMGSPIGPEGFMYSACTEHNTMKPFKHFKLSKYDCLKQDGYWLDKEDIDLMVSMWGESHPLVQSSVYGNFCQNIEGGVITLADIENCIRTPALPDYSGGKHIGLDFAAGGDSNVIVFRNGNELKIIKEWKDRDTMNASRTFANELDILKREYGITQSDVSGDDDGLGKPMIDRLSELGWNINRFHGGSAAKDTSCKNLITDYWLNGCKKIRNRSIIMPNNQELKLQLTSRKSYMNQSGKLCLESKEDMRSRGVPSPDIADAFFLSLGTPVNGLVTFLKVPLPTPRKYSIF